jgi:hypothetical protein
MGTFLKSTVVKRAKFHKKVKEIIKPNHLQDIMTINQINVQGVTKDLIKATDAISRDLNE